LASPVLFLIFSMVKVICRVTGCLLKCVCVINAFGCHK
jgi:hypothetical protein